MLKHYLEIFYPGLLFSESEIKEVENRDPNNVVIPDNAYGYRFFDRIELIREKDTLTGPKKNYSPMTYFGRAYTLEEVKKLFPKEEILIKNMIHNHWRVAVKTRMGNWQILRDGDVVIN